MTASKKISTILLTNLFFLFSIFAVPTIFAANIQTDINTTITVSRLGQATVVHHITLTNTNPTQFVSDYAFKINSGKAEEITVYNNEEEVEDENINIIGDQRQTTVGISLPTRVVGEGQQNTIQISYLSHDLVIATPQTLSVFLPKLANPGEINSHRVEVIYPAVFGNSVVSQPPAQNIVQQEETIKVELDNVIQNGMQLVIGENQFYSLAMSVPLVNTTNTPQTYQLAIPPDTTHQQVFYETLEPKPDAISTDADGNWITTYYLAPSETKQVSGQILVKKSVNELNPISLPAIKEHTKPTSVWESASGKLQKEFNQKTSVDIYNHLIKSVEFDFTTENSNIFINQTNTDQILDRITSLNTLEMVNLLVASLRKAHIPAKQVVGFAYSPNSQLRPSINTTNLHAWVDFYTDRWYTADPTWENTTGGVNYFQANTPHHIVYGYHGINSNTPIIAGTKTENIESTIDVTFADNFPNLEPTLEISIVTNKFLGIPIPGWYNLVVLNNSGKAFYHLPITNQAPAEVNIKIAQQDIPIILPYQKLEVPILVLHDHLSSPLPTNVQLQVNDQTYQLKLSAGPKFIQVFALDRTLVGGFVGFGIITSLATGSLLVFRRR